MVSVGETENKRTKAAESSRLAVRQSTFFPPRHNPIAYLSYARSVENLAKRLHHHVIIMHANTSGRFY